MAKRLAPPEDYEQCDSCGTWRPKEKLQATTTSVTTPDGKTITETTPGCVERDWCQMQQLEVQRRKGNTT